MLTFNLFLLFIEFINCSEFSNATIFRTEELQQLLALELAIKEFTPEETTKPSEVLENDEDDRFFWTTKIESPKIPPIAKIGTEFEARKLMRYASIAYCPLDTIKNWRCSNCNELTQGTSDVVLIQNHESGTYGYLAVNSLQQIIIVSMRGTDGLYDWMSNLKISQTNLGLPYPFQNAKAHQGFNTFAEGVVNELKFALRRAIKRYPHYRVIFTGHSKGGALASLLAVKMFQHGVLPWDKIHLYTYGMPRVGNSELAKYINSVPVTLLRVTSYADIIPVIPKLLYNYEHFQHHIHITNEKTSRNCSIYEEDINCTNDFWLPSIASHFDFWDLRINSACI